MNKEIPKKPPGLKLRVVEEGFSYHKYTNILLGVLLILVIIAIFAPFIKHLISSI